MEGEEISSVAAAAAPKMPWKAMELIQHARVRCSEPWPSHPIALGPLFRLP